MSNYILSTKNICKNFKKQIAVNNVTISIPESTVYGLLGPNGAGKSTLLKMITGMISPTSGEIKFCGEKWNRRHLSNIGSLIESPPLYENLTAWENMKVRATMLNIPMSRIESILDLVELSNTKNKLSGQFSMGMKQRLGIALALLNNPKLLILDEPTNGLDPIGIQDLRELICSFPSKGITVVLSSHILSEVEQIVDYIGIISNGILGFEGKMTGIKDLEKLFLEIVREHKQEGKIA